MDQYSKPCPCKDDKDEAVPEKLLEECWFFSNLLDKKIIMSKNPSDSYTLSNCSQHNLAARKSYEETYESIKKQPQQDEPRMSTSLMRAPSMPPRLERKHSNNPITKGCDLGNRTSKEETLSSSSLARVPSLPMSLGAEEVEDEEEIEFSMGKLIRQASLKTTSDAMPLTRYAAMVATTVSSSTPRRKQEFDSLKLERLRPRRVMSQLKTQKSLSDLQSKELQGIKDLGLQEQKKKEDVEGKNTRRPQDSAPPVPEWGGKRSKEEDMKAQIKFWARAVASNAR